VAWTDGSSQECIAELQGKGYKAPSNMSKQRVTGLYQCLPSKKRSLGFNWYTTYYISDILYYLNAYLFLFIPINAMIFDIAVPLRSHLADAGLLGPTWRFHVEFQFSLWDMWAQPVWHGIQKMQLFMKSSQSSFNHLSIISIISNSMKSSHLFNLTFFFGCETLVLHPFITDNPWSQQVPSAP
jgi:hypothetical protein